MSHKYRCRNPKLLANQIKKYIEKIMHHDQVYSIFQDISFDYNPKMNQCNVPY